MGLPFGIAVDDNEVAPLKSRHGVTPSCDRMSFEGHCFEPERSLYDHGIRQGSDIVVWPPHPEPAPNLEPPRFSHSSSSNEISEETGSTSGMSMQHGRPLGPNEQKLCLSLPQSESAVCKPDHCQPYHRVE